MREIEKIVGKHRCWLSQSDDMVARELKYLDEDLANESLAGLNNVPDSLEILAVYHGKQGEVSVFSNDPSGWVDISRAIIYRYWALILRAKIFSKTRFLQNIRHSPNLTNQLSGAGCLLAGFIAADRQDLAEPVADIIEGMYSVKGAVNPEYLKGRRFEPFMLWLYSAYVGRNVISLGKDMDLGVYQKLIDAWVDEQKLSSALVEVCQYHLDNSEDKGGRDPEFKSPPFDLLPLEMSAVFRVLKKSGFPLPVVASPLLSVGLAALENLIFKSDEVTQKVEAAYIKFFG